MLQLKSKGIVVRRKVDESGNVLVTFFTDAYSIVMCRAPGGAKSRKRFVNAFEHGTLCEINFSYRKSAIYYHLDEMWILEYPRVTDLFQLYFLHGLCECAWRSFPHGISRKSLFSTFVKGIYNVLSEKTHAGAARSFLKALINILLLEGLYHPSNHCFKCGNRLKVQERIYLTYTRGLSCEKCKAGIPLEPSKAELTSWDEIIEKNNRHTFHWITSLVTLLGNELLPNTYPHILNTLNV